MNFYEQEQHWDRAIRTIDRTTSNFFSTQTSVGFCRAPTPDHCVLIKRGERAKSDFFVIQALGDFFLSHAETNQRNAKKSPPSPFFQARKKNKTAKFFFASHLKNPKRNQIFGLTAPVSDTNVYKLASFDGRSFGNLWACKIIGNFKFVLSY